MRRVFLWAARNRWLKDASAAAAVHAASRPPVHARRDDGRRAGGRGAAAGGRDRDDVHAARREPREPGRGRRRRRPLHRAASTGSRPPGSDGEISVKPTQLGPRPRPRRLPRRTSSGSPSTRPPPARTSGSTWRAAPTPRRPSSCYERLRAVAAEDRHLPAGVPAPDRPPTSTRLLPLDPAIRLVKGAYDEPAAIAFRDKRAVDASYAGLAVRFLLDGRGTADPAGPRARTTSGSSSRSRRRSAPAGVGRDGFEVEMLYGIRADEQLRLAKAGYRVQVLIAYGEHWYPWYMRRLAERPANVPFALRQMLLSR